MMNWIKGSVIGLTLAGASVFGGAAQAVVVPATAIYNANSAEFSTTGSVNGNGFKIGDGNSISFDLSGLHYSSIVSFVLDVVYKKTADTATEAWVGKITGTNSAAGGFAFSLVGTNTAQKTYSTTLTSGAAFDAAAMDKLFKVTFNDTNPAGTNPDKFFLKTVGAARAPGAAILTVNYVAAVPLPAGGLLLLAGLGGLLMAGRRKTS